MSCQNTATVLHVWAPLPVRWKKELDQTAALCRCQKITPKAKRHFFIYCTKAWNGRTAEGEKTFLCNFSPPEGVLLGHAADCRPTLAVCAYGRLLWALLESLAKHSTDCVRLENSSLTASLKAPIVRPPDSRQIYNLTRHYRSWSLMTWPSPTPTQECRRALWLSSLLSRQWKWASPSADTLETSKLRKTEKERTRSDSWRTC